MRTFYGEYYQDEAVLTVERQAETGKILVSLKGATFALDHAQALLMAEALTQAVDGVCENGINEEGLEPLPYEVRDDEIPF